MYNQKLDPRTKYSCTIYTMLNIIKWDYGIEVQDSTIFKIVAYMEKIWALMPKGAYFSVIYPAMCKLISWKTWLNLKVEKSSISKWLDDKSTWSLWAKRLSSLSIKLSQDGWITVADMKEIAKSEKGSGHNHACKLWNESNQWNIIESWGWTVYKTSLAALKEGVLLWIYYDTARTLLPADDRTKRIQKKMVKKVKETWEFLQLNKSLLK